MTIKGRYELLYISIPLVILAFLYANKFTVVGMGEDFSANLGLNYNRVVNIGVSIVALIYSLVVITVGRITFLGLIVPNMVTILGTISIILILLFIVIGLNGNNWRYLLTRRIPKIEAIIITGASIAFSSLLYRFLFQKEKNNIMILLLVGLVLGTLFQSISSFMQMIIDSNEFLHIQDICYG